ncbi:DUF3857 domain-containing protein [Flavipsychrobacter stenotrophus]|uniref:DUF3857 domain-containing protein n=1 Tax=Flavipsychrobacter stenotrophus TaxID=2077091 RepID=UPI001374E8A7|nr:DUF3857 domain-containing protein [Flavipsychrobacter stenotrophus]
MFNFLASAAATKEIDETFIKKHLQTQVYPIDPDAAAVVLYEKTDIELSYLNNALTKVYTYHKLVKILKASAFSEANVHIFYSDNFFGRVEKVRGYTHHLNGDALVTEEIDRRDLLKKDVSENVNSVSFTLPSVKEGCVIEYSYDIRSNYKQTVLTWDVQDEYPKLESSFNITYPTNIEFTSITHVGMACKSYKEEEDAENAADNFACVRTINRANQSSYWIRRNIAAEKEEAFVQNKHNNAERLEMQMTGINTPTTIMHFNNSWDKINDELWERQKYKDMLFGINDFFDKALDSLLTPAMSAKGKTAAIYKYVRAHYHCSKKMGRISNTNLRKLEHTSEVNVAEINALLTAMLIRAKLPAAMILMSTTASVSPTETFPVLDRINYMACVVMADTEQILLDASDPNNIFGILPTYCYNGFSWILGNKGQGVNLTPDLIKNKNTYNFKINEFTDSTARLEITKKTGLLHSVAYRKAWVKNKEQKQKDIDYIKDHLPGNITVLESHVDNQDNPDTNLIMKYTCIMDLGKEPTTFINTNIIKVYESNPFKAGERKAPIEFPYKSEYAFFTSITLPPEMEPDTLAQPTAISYNNGEIYYRKMMGYIPDIHLLTVNSSFEINATSYESEWNTTIREFFQKMIDNSNEMIAIKKQLRNKTGAKH